MQSKFWFIKYETDNQDVDLKASVFFRDQKVLIDNPNQREPTIGYFKLFLNGRFY